MQELQHSFRHWPDLLLPFGVRIFSLWFLVLCYFCVHLFVYLPPPSGTAVYVAVGRHTVIPIVIVLLFQTPLYVGLCVTFRRLRDLSTPSPSAQTQCSEASKDNNGAELELDSEKEEMYQMYSVKLETRL